MADWYRKTVEETLKELNTDITTGLSYKQAEERLNSYGKNELVDGALKKPWKIIMEQASGIMVIMLVIAGIISFFLGETTDAIVILAIVVINILLGFSQEYKAEKAMAALRKMSLPTVKVKREGKLIEISSKELVPGDIIQIDAGNSIPADCRIIQSVNLKVQESALTGESEPIEKMSDVISDVNLSLGDRKNTGYMGTVSTSGRGTAVVTQTGMNTELGHIAKMMQSVDRQPTPLQKKLDQLGKLLAVIALAIVAIVFVLGIFRGEDIQVLFMTAISMAVAAVPEGLPALVTISLALGTQRLLKRNALIRKLLAVETLGSVSVICSDKTGTLTQNKMTVTSIYTSTLGAADINGLKVSSPDIKMLLTAGLL
ncbi:MAG TPA: HAD-IC family P-type ATPase, partial [Petrotogaceae bacterium]|nr:HAD-IC family P-type ATPase [Petrotogaceae bacterium]